ncbi:tail fiber assembly protein [Achromobacter mucicolens]|uniref:tail fiber assembly protein n=1 Tax=Achromobacter mucicolens TaxID=1389922 RepID=UPI00289EAF51|nr:tail fiber assembly protein [Achromobacter mucicolens]
MQIYFSPGTAGFYFDIDQSLYEQAGSWPTDLVPVDDETYARMMEATANGFVIVASADGSPMAEQAVRSVEEIAAFNSRARDNRLETATLRIAPLQDAVDLNIASEEEIARLAAWKAYRVDVNRVDVTHADPGWPDSPEV